MSTNPQNNKRKTKQIRIDEKIHRELKLEAFKNGKTISRFADEIIKEFLNKSIRTYM